MNTKQSLQQLSGVSTAFLQSLSPQDTYKALLEEALRLFTATHGSLFLRFQHAWHRVYTTIPDGKQTQPRPRGLAYLSFKTHRPVVMTRKEFLKNHKEVKEADFVSMVIIPLSYNNTTLGVITIHSPKKVILTKKQEDILNIFSSLATLSIKKTQLYEESKNALRMRDLFISLAAHELRTPLTTINTYVQLLKKRLQGTGLPQNVWIEKLSFETTLIIKLVNELLNLDSIRHGAFVYHMKPVTFKTIIKRAVQQFSVVFPFHTILIKDQTAGNEVVIGDPDKLLQMLNSLLENAAQFSSVEKEIVVTVAKHGSSLLLQVADKGIGIPKKDIQKIFHGFYKGSNNYKDGIGLGLFLSRQIIEKHKGSIHIVSQKNKGTTIEVVLPKANI